MNNASPFRKPPAYFLLPLRLLSCQISLVNKAVRDMGRFAGLIITLGVGVAVLSGHGLARAEPSEPSSGTSSDSPKAASTDSPSESSASTGAQTTSEATSTAVSPANSEPMPSKDPTSPSSPETAPQHSSRKSHSDTIVATHLRRNS